MLSSTLTSFVAAISVPHLPLYFLGFGIISAVLGLLGWMRAKSKASLIAGVGCGLLLIASWWLMNRGEVAGKWIGLGVSALLTARFLPSFLVKKHLYPAGIMALLGIIGTVLALLTVF
jgi:uncharacterized membrane protein (UPF0136 family)